MGYDLFLESPRGTLLPLSERKQLLQNFDDETNLDGPCEITDMTDSFASPLDIETLENCFRNGEFSREEYKAFCARHDLMPDDSQEVACEAANVFLDFMWGQKLFSPKLPREDKDVREAYRLIVEFARKHKLVVHDPQAGKDIDLRNPGEFPPRWHR